MAHPRTARCSVRLVRALPETRHAKLEANASHSLWARHQRAGRLLVGFVVVRRRRHPERRRARRRARGRRVAPPRRCRRRRDLGGGAWKGRWTRRAPGPSSRCEGGYLDVRSHGRSESGTVLHHRRDRRLRRAYREWRQRYDRSRNDERTVRHRGPCDHERRYEARLRLRSHVPRAGDGDHERVRLWRPRVPPERGKHGRNRRRARVVLHRYARLDRTHGAGLRPRRGGRDLRDVRGHGLHRPGRRPHDSRRVEHCGHVESVDGGSARTSEGFGRGWCSRSGGRGGVLELVCSDRSGWDGRDGHGRRQRRRTCRKAGPEERQTRRHPGAGRQAPRPP